MFSTRSYWFNSVQKILPGRLIELVESIIRINKRDWRSTNKLWTGKLQGYEKGGVWGVYQHRSRHIMSVHVFQLLSSKPEMELLIQHTSLYHMAWSVTGWLSSSDSILILIFNLRRWYPFLHETYWWCYPIAVILFISCVCSYYKRFKKMNISLIFIIFFANIQINQFF